MGYVEPMMSLEEMMKRWGRFTILPAFALSLMTVGIISMVGELNVDVIKKVDIKLLYQDMLKADDSGITEDRAGFHEGGCAFSWYDGPL
jgi:hypothetical protein